MGSSDPKDEKTEATVYRQRETARTWLEQYFHLKDEFLEEGATERERYFDSHALLIHLHGRLRVELVRAGIDPNLNAKEVEPVLMNIQGEDRRLRYRTYAMDYRWCDECLEHAPFPKEFAKDRDGSQMEPKESVGWNYQVKTAGFMRSIDRLECDLMLLGVLPRESADDIEERDDTEALQMEATKHA